jgi:hypothetical protein
MAGQLIDLGFKVGVTDDFDTRLNQVLATKTPPLVLDSTSVDFIRAHTVGAVKPYNVYAQGIACGTCRTFQMMVSVEPGQ